MKIPYCSHYAEMFQKAAGSVLPELREVQQNWICTATGNLPIGNYDALVHEYKKTLGSFEQLGIVKLDDWGGIPMDSPNSCETVIKETILLPMSIPDER
ncbi:galactosamine-6-phosphate isomerase [Pricia antarctica]|uniref:Galactosamine-6-phosphate isomerase n=1 Tax=Pricia antarctica TaxID=641691 RepID=A0A1G6XVM1_9FLAO|nr:hypothetical protein [Pricia antarctica]SDD82219.1 galactosamine-6-phosphate isomerase [Pricia antarctica]